jgi:ribosomal protein S18 acetylase RimI-like enzyme
MASAEPAASIRRLPGELAERAAGALARGFVRDPAWVWAIPDERRRARVLPWFFRAATRYALRHGEVHGTVEGAHGAVIALPPEAPRLVRPELARVGLWQMPLRAGIGGFRRFLVQYYVLEERHVADVPPRHWYVWLLGVDPAHQGRGTGGAVLGSVLARADQQQLPTYLDTTNERNLPFYERHGFRVVASGSFPGGPCPYWTLVRAPRAPAGTGPPGEVG